MNRSLARRSGDTRESNADGGFTAEDIESLLHIDGDATAVEEACAALGVSATTYETWKTKYEGLTASQIRARWSRARRSRRAMIAAAVAAVLGLGYLALPGGAPPTRASAAEYSQTFPTAFPAASPAASNTPSSTAQPEVVVSDSPSTPAVASEREEHPLPAPAPAEPVSAETPSASKTPSGPATVGQAGYSVQVAALPNPQTANALVERLAGRGLNAYMALTTVGTAQMYRVRVGPFATRQEAEKLAQRLERDGHPSPWIVGTR